MKTITIAAVAGADPVGHAAAILRTQAVVPYQCETVLFTPPSKRVFPVHRQIAIPDWGNDRRAWEPELNKFIVGNLADHITTDVVILVQADGYGVNQKAWTDEFLNWDYIGAPCPLWTALLMKGTKTRRVGSGGFCLRSMKFLEAGRELPYDGTIGEDVYCYRHSHEFFEYRGCRFAPFKLARQWAVEDRLFGWDARNSFGFHGVTQLYSLRFPQSLLLAWNRARRFA